MSQERFSEEIEVLRAEIVAKADAVGWAELARQIGMREDTLAKFGSGKNKKPRAETLATLFAWRDSQKAAGDSDAAPLGEQYLRAQRLPLSVFQGAPDSAAQAYADLFKQYSAGIEHANGQLRLFEAALSGGRVMLEQLEAYEETTPQAQELLRAFREFNQRENLLLRLAMDMARNGRTTEQDLSRFGAVSVLNQVLFEIGLQPVSRRPVLSRERHKEWLDQLGLQRSEEHLKNTRIGYTIGRDDRAEIRDEANRLIAFFDGRLLSD